MATSKRCSGSLAINSPACLSQYYSEGIYSWAAFLAALPRSFLSGSGFTGRWDRRMAEARAIAASRRSGRYPDLAVEDAMFLKVLCRGILC